MADKEKASNALSVASTAHAGAATAMAWFPPASIILGAISMTLGIIGEGVGRSGNRDNVLASAEASRDEVAAARETAKAEFDESFKESELGLAEKESSFEDQRESIEADNDRTTQSITDYKSAEADSNKAVSDTRSQQLFDIGMQIDPVAKRETQGAEYGYNL